MDVSSSKWYHVPSIAAVFSLNLFYLFCVCVLFYSESEPVLAQQFKPSFQYRKWNVSAGAWRSWGKLRLDGSCALLSHAHFLIRNICSFLEIFKVAPLATFTSLWQGWFGSLKLGRVLFRWLGFSFSTKTVVYTSLKHLNSKKLVASFSKSSFSGCHSRACCASVHHRVWLAGLVPASEQPLQGEYALPSTAKHFH